MAKVGVFGGSFNPIHEGHVNFIKQVKHRLNFDKIILIICKNSFHKNVNLISKHHRLKMCELATQGLPYVTVSNIEFEIDQSGCGLYTLQKIKRQHPTDDLFLIVGPDSFLKLESWNKFRQIISSVTIVSGFSNRSQQIEMQQLLNKFKFNAVLLNLVLSNYHSTLIRIKLAQNLNCRSYLNYNVLNYIIRHRLYVNSSSLYLECENACKNLVSIRRFNHCVLVSKMAQSLAEIFRENVDKAALAGLLHDIVKEQSPPNLIKILKLGGISLKNLSEVDRLNPKLWHAPAGAIYCNRVLGIVDDQILSAIACHTTGKANMTNFDKIVFIADNTSADRKGLNAKIERKLAFKNLDKALFFHLKNYIQLSCKKNNAVHLDSINCFNQLALSITVKKINDET